MYLDDLNGTLGNLGWDAQSLEEGSLLGTHTSVLSGHHYVQGSQSSGLSGRLDLVGQQQVPDLHQVLVREHEANVLLDVGQQPKINIYAIPSDINILHTKINKNIPFKVCVWSRFKKARLHNL